MFWKMQDIRRIRIAENTQIKYNSEKQTTQNTGKQNYRGSVAFYDTQTGNEVGLFYDASETTRGVSFGVM